MRLYRLDPNLDYGKLASRFTKQNSTINLKYVVDRAYPRIITACIYWFCGRKKWAKRGKKPRFARKKGSII